MLLITLNYIYCACQQQLILKLSVLKKFNSYRPRYKTFSDYLIRPGSNASNLPTLLNNRETNIIKAIINVKKALAER